MQIYTNQGSKQILLKIMSKSDSGFEQNAEHNPKQILHKILSES